MNRDDILMEVEKPSRYLGGEANRPAPRDGVLNFVLAFPDTYEVGMSHLGIKILYGILNSLPEVTTDRVFAPWVDLEDRLRREGLPLWGLDSGRPLKEFDVIGFSLQYELSYANLLNMLDLGGIPLERNARKEGAPLVIAGGPGAFNPAPLADFIDAFVIGEGEEVIGEICSLLIEGKRKRWPRRDLLLGLAEIPGVYVPAIDVRGPVIKRIVQNLDAAWFPETPLVPLMQTIHDRAVVEIARGCTRGCRFCQAGMVWRPARERSLGKILGLSEGLLCSTGYDELSLLSLSAGDYQGIEELLSRLMEKLGPKKVALGLPSLRVETLSRKMIEEIKKVRKTSFTLAPEAGTQRLRDVINKGNRDEDLLATAAEVFAAGWQAVKLYFMIGLPQEQKEDLEGIVDLSLRLAHSVRPRGRVTVSLSTFVPKPHTPFQWEPQLTQARIREAHAYFRGRLTRKNLVFRWHDERMSLLEGLISRGDERVGRVIKRAFQLGARFDGWSEMFRFDLWEQALAGENIALETYLGEWSKDKTLPWGIISPGLAEGFLHSERVRAKDGLLTPDCRSAACHGCGVCPPNGYDLAKREDMAPPNEPPPHLLAADEETPQPTGKYRLTYRKRDRARFLSHLEIVGALIRALKRIPVNFVFSQGFHPHPEVSFGPATSVGMESECEYLEMTVEKPREEMEILLLRLNSFLPAGLTVISAEELPPGSAGLARQIYGFVYEMHPLPENDPALLAERICAFLKEEKFEVARLTPKGKKMKDIRPLVANLRLIDQGRGVLLEAVSGPEGSVRPGEILTAVLGLAPTTVQMMRVVKTGLIRR